MIINNISSSQKKTTREAQYIFHSQILNTEMGPNQRYRRKYILWKKKLSQKLGILQTEFCKGCRWVTNFEGQKVQDTEQFREVNAILTLKKGNIFRT